MTSQNVRPARLQQTSQILSQKEQNVISPQSRSELRSQKFAFNSAKKESITTTNQYSNKDIENIPYSKLDKTIDIQQ